MIEIIITIIVLTLVLIMPNRYVFVFLVIPVIVLSDYLGLVKPILSFGDADVRLQDLVVFLAAAKSLLPSVSNINVYRGSPLIVPLVLFTLLLLIANIIAYIRLGEVIFIGETISLLRMSSQFITCILVSLSVNKKEHLEVIKFIDYIGILIGATVYYNILFLSSGFTIGEVQATTYTTRYFGPVGDQVGFILVYFCVKSFMDRRWLISIFHIGAIWSTGTRGTIIALIVAVLMIARMKSELRISSRMIVSLVVIFSIISITMLYLNVGGLWSRVFQSELQFGLNQRIATFIVASRVFYENPIIGVGFTGFRYVALDYGAWELFNSFPNVYFIYNAIATTGNQYLQVLTDGGILAFFIFSWLMIRSIKVLRTASDILTGEFRNTMLAGYVWLVSLLIGNQSATWLLPNSLISSLLFILLGFAVATNQLRLTERSIISSSRSISTSSIVTPIP